MEEQTKRIEAAIAHQKKLQEEAQAKKDEEEDEQAESKKEESKKETSKEKPEEVDSYKIKAVVSLVDEFTNIVSKNISVYAHYDDFSFSSSRSSEDLKKKLGSFFSLHFSGDFQMKNHFEPKVLPRIFYLEPKTKFVYSYKILNYMTQALMIQNK